MRTTIFLPCGELNWMHATINDKSGPEEEHELLVREMPPKVDEMCIITKELIELRRIITIARIGRRMRRK